MNMKYLKFVFSLRVRRKIKKLQRHWHFHMGCLSDPGLRLLVNMKVFQDELES